MVDADLLQFHAFCLTRTGTRLEQYSRAIAQRVAPGQTVLDIGTGTGVLTFLACRAGARHVYALESSEAISLAKLLAAQTGFEHRVHFIRASSLEATLPDRVDTIVADIHDTFGLQRGGLATLLDARDRFLRPDGALIPASIKLLVAAVEAPDVYGNKVDVWQGSVHGVELAPLRKLAVNQQHVARFEPHELLSEPTVIASLDLANIRTVHAGGTADCIVTRDGTLHGICGCFVTTLADGLVVQNIPGDSGTTNFAQAFFPIESPFRVTAGDAITIAIDTFDGYATRWQLTGTSRNGERLGRFDHSTIESVSLDEFRKQADDYRPMLTERGKVERALLDKFDGTHSAAELESWLAKQFGTVLPSRQALSSFLKNAIDRFG